MNEFTRNRVSRDSEPGRYNFAKPSEKAYQFYFHFREAFDIGERNSARYGVTVSEDSVDEIDDASPLAAAESLLAYMKRTYLYTRSIKELESVVEYLRPFEEDDERQERLYRINNLRERLAKEEKDFATIFGEPAVAEGRS